MAVREKPYWEYQNKSLVGHCHKMNKKPFRPIFENTAQHDYLARKRLN